MTSKDFSQVSPVNFKSQSISPNLNLTKNQCPNWQFLNPNLRLQRTRSFSDRHIDRAATRRWSTTCRRRTHQQWLRPMRPEPVNKWSTQGGSPSMWAQDFPRENKVQMPMNLKTCESLGSVPSGQLRGSQRCLRAIKVRSLNSGVVGWKCKTFTKTLRLLLRNIANSMRSKTKAKLRSSLTLSLRLEI